MAQYYAIERSSDYLAHYGVKGMRWGVRRALRSGDTSRLNKALGRQYKKAQKKLDKLNDQADINKQRQRAEYFDKSSKKYRIAGRVGLGLALSGTGVNHLINNRYTKFLNNRRDAEIGKVNEELQKAWDRADKYKQKMNFDNQPLSVQIKANKYVKESMFDPIQKHTDKLYEDWENDYKKAGKISDISDYVRAAGAGMAIGSYGGAALHKVMANRARNRMTSSGHKEALSKRDAWQREMNKAFAGTAYANGGSNKKNSAKVAGVRVGKHFIGVSNKPITEEKRNEVRRLVKAEYARSRKNRK